jgi:hypothetical protein
MKKESKMKSRTKEVDVSLPLSSRKKTLEKPVGLVSRLHDRLASYRELWGHPSIINERFYLVAGL